VVSYDPDTIRVPSGLIAQGSDPTVIDTYSVHTYPVDMNLTLSVDERVVQEARKAAESMGITLNQAVREFLEGLAGGRSAEDDVRELEELSARSRGDSHGWRFNRDEIHERS
jgi:hypothetical protein